MCWITDTAGSGWRIVGGKGVEWFSWIFVVFVYWRTITHVRTLAPLMTEQQRYTPSHHPYPLSYHSDHVLIVYH